MTGCSVPQCFENGVHHFPKDPETRKRWIKAIRRKKFQPKYFHRLCRNHFVENDYLKVSLYTGLEMERKILKKSAVPSVFPWNQKPLSTQAKAREERLIARNRVADDKIITPRIVFVESLSTSATPAASHESSDIIEERPQRRKRQSSKAQEEIGSLAKKLVGDNTVNITSTDSDYTFSLSLGQQLSLLPRDQRIKAKKLMADVLYLARKNQLTEKSKVVRIPPKSPSLSPFRPKTNLPVPSITSLPCMSSIPCTSPSTSSSLSPQDTVKPPKLASTIISNPNPKKYSLSYTTTSTKSSAPLIIRQPHQNTSSPDSSSSSSCALPSTSASLPTRSTPIIIKRSNLLTSSTSSNSLLALTSETDITKKKCTTLTNPSTCPSTSSSLQTIIIRRLHPHNQNQPTTKTITFTIKNKHIK